MLEQDANDAAAALERHVNDGCAAGQEISAVAQRESWKPESIHPWTKTMQMVEHQVRVTAGDRSAALALEDAQALLSAVDAGCGADGLFQQIEARGLVADESSGTPSGTDSDA